jgi:MFS family permease
MMANRWSYLALLSVIRVAMGVQFQAVGTAGPAMRDELGLDYASLGALTGSYLILGMFLALPAGWLSTRFGDRRILLGGLGLMVVGGAGLGLGLAASFPVALGFRLLSGVGAVALSIVVTKLAMDRFQDESLGTAMGVLLGAWPLGIAGASLLLPYAVAAAGWRAVMLGTAGACAAFMVLAALAVPKTRRAVASHAGMGGRVIAAVGAAGVIWVLANAGYLILLGFAPDYFVEKDVSLAAAGAVLSLASLGTIPVGPLGGWLGQRFGHGMKLSALCMAVVAGAIAAVPLVGASAWWMLAMGAVLGLPSGLMVALPARVLPPASRAVGMGLFYSVFYAGVGVLSPFAGWVRDVTGVAEAPLWTGAALNLLAVPAIGAFVLLEARVRRGGRPGRA